MKKKIWTLNRVLDDLNKQKKPSIIANTKRGKSFIEHKKYQMLTVLHNTGIPEHT